MSKHDDRSCKITLVICLLIMALGCYVSTKLRIPKTMTMTAILGTIGFTIAVLLLMIEDALKKLIHNIKSKKHSDEKNTIKEEPEKIEDDGYSDEECNYYEKRFWHDHHKRIF